LSSGLRDTVEDSAGSTLIFRVSGAGLGAGFALLKSSFPDGFGFGGSSLASSLTSFGSDLTTGLVSSVAEGAFERRGSLFLEVEAAAAEDFVFAEVRAGWRSVRFCGEKQSTVIVRTWTRKLTYFDVPVWTRDST
jgi:hypothetical protein